MRDVLATLVALALLTLVVIVPLVALAPRAAPRTAAPSPAATSLEAQIGGRWLLYLGVGALVVAAAYFVKLAFESGWVTETMRVVIGGLTGALLPLRGRDVRRLVGPFLH